MRRGLMAAALALLAALAPATAQADFSDYGLESVEASISTTQAGGHPDLSFGFKVKTNPATPVGPTGAHEPYAATKDLTIGLPPGLIGNPNAVDRCAPAQFETAFEEGGQGGCPRSSQIGIAKVQAYTTNFIYTEPIFNLTPPPDAPAQLGLYVGPVPVIVKVGVRSDGDYGLNSVTEGITTFEELVSAETTIWGVPGDPVHDTERITAFEANNGASSSPERPSGLAEVKPFLQNPTRCGVAQELFVQTTTYQVPGLLSRMDATLPALSGCGALKFGPEFTATPTNPEAAAPTGLDVDLRLPQDETLGGRATAQLRNATVDFPPGMTLAAGAADGLAACSEAQVGYGVSPPPPSACPPASKLGSAEFDVPQLPHPIEGAIYQRTPGPPGQLFRIWLVSDELGVHVKIPGEIRLDPLTGQVSSLFVDNPQVPLRELKLHVFGGSHAPFATPFACGTYQTRFEFTPWSGTAPVVGQTPMTISSNCATGGFSPTLSAGAVDPTAGAFSSFVLRLDRQSSEQNLAGLEVKLPPGVLGKLKGVPLCPEAAAATGACPAGSQVGEAKVASGPGPAPLWLPQPGREPISLYLAGPYKGAPYSLVVNTPAQAGPFDLGTVVVRAGIYLDLETAQITVKTDPLPQILEGVPITYRTLYTTIDRPEFTLNPTSCEPSAVKATLTSPAGASAEASSRFQVGSCASLDYKPGLKLSLSGSVKRSGHPALKAVVAFPHKSSEANTAQIQVALPHSEFLDPNNLDKVCKQADLKAGTCPAGSVYGHVKAFTPLLDEPLEGPVYLGVGYGHELPDLVTDLNGQIRILAHGRVDTTKEQGLRNTFEVIPDGPVSRIVLQLKGGKKYGLIENSEYLCRKTQLARAKFVAQNGRVITSRPKIANGCKRKKAKRSARHHRRR